jgi:hypothetical protein
MLETSGKAAIPFSATKLNHPDARSYSFRPLSYTTQRLLESTTHYARYTTHTQLDDDDEDEDESEEYVPGDKRKAEDGSSAEAKKVKA